MHNIRYAVADDGIATATLDMPGRPFNVFSDDMIDELTALLDHVEAQPPRGLILASGKDAFMAGADLAMVRGFTSLRFRATPEAIRTTFSRLSRLMRRLERLPMPTVAAVNGLALGGGLELAMACHRRVASESAMPCLGLPEIGLGLLPGAGGTQRLPRLVGLDAGARMLLDGLPITPGQALALGLVDALAAPDALLTAARAQFAGLAPGARWDEPGWQAPRAGHALIEGDGAAAALLRHAGIDARKAHLYPAYGAICGCLIEGYDRPMDEAIEVEADQFLPLMLGPVAGNMVRTSFLSKTAAPKRAAQALAATPGTVKRIAVLGLEPVPERLARAFTLVSLEASPELILQRTSAPGEQVLTLSAHSDTVTADGPVALRFAGGIEASAAVEIAAAPGPLAALALAVAQRLRLVPTAVAPSAPGPCERLLVAARAWLAAHADGRLAELAHAVDAAGLLRRAGVEVTPADAHDATDRAAGLALLAAVAEAAAAVMHDGLLAEPADMDVLAVFALDYPAWTGGPLSFQDMQGRGEAGPAVPSIHRAPWYPA